MRPQVVIVVLLAAAGILGTILLTPKTNPRAVPEPPAAGSVAAAETNSPPASPAPAPALLPVSGSTMASADVPAAPPTNREAYVQQRVAALMALAMNDDATSLNAIWSELGNPDQAIRKGALEAVIQFGDRSAAPRLREFAGQIVDPAEKADFLAAADRLEMPALGEAPPPPDKP